MAWSPRVGISLALTICIFLVVKGRDVLPQKENYLPSYSVYHNVTSLTDTVVRLASKYPKLMSIHQTFRSRQNLPIQVLRVRPSQSVNFDTGRPLRVLLVAGEHAREFFPVESILHFIVRILYSPSSQISEFVRTNFDLYVVPMLNPDGRRHIERSSNFCWRGTSTGVDIGRNFPWEFGKGSGSSSKTNDEEFRGTTPLSEPESRIIQELSDSIKFDGFVTFHSGIRHIYIPYSDSKSHTLRRQPRYWKMLEAISAKMVASMRNDAHHTFLAGPAWKLNDYYADGTIFDFMAGVQHVPVSLAVELWGEGDRSGVACFDLFNPRNKDLKTEVERLLPLYETFFKSLWSFRVNLTRHRNNSTSRPGSETPYPLLALVACMVVVLAVVCKRRMCSSNTSQWRLFSSGRKRIISLRSFGQRFSFTSLKSV